MIEGFDRLGSGQTLGRQGYFAMKKRNIDSYQAWMREIACLAETAIANNRAGS
jgi:hypothetical protein